jgi:hypothetical protein
MYRRRLVPLCTAVAALAAATACGGDAPETAPQTESTASAPSPSPSPDPSAPPADADPAPPGSERSPDALADHPLAGSWEGPVNSDGSVPEITVAPVGTAELLSSGHTCQGRTEPLGGGEYRIEFGRCVVPLPPGRARLVEGGDTMEIVIDGVSEEWVRVDGP